MMKRLILTVLLLGTAGAASAATTFKIATLAPGNSEWFRAMQESADEIRERTDGRVEIKLYGGGVMGSDEQVFRKIRIGQLQGAATTPTVLTDSYEDIGLYTLPMIFRNEAEAAYARQRLDARLMQGLEEAGFVSFGFAATGFSVILSNEPIRDIDDLRGQRIWAPPGDPVGLAALRALNLVPVLKPMADVYTSLQTGNIDVVPFSPIGALVLQLHTEVDYLTDLPMVYTVGLMVIDRRFFSKLSPGDQQVVRDVLGRLYARYDEKNLVDNAEAKQAVIGSGVEKIVPDAAETQEIREIVLDSNRKLAEQGEFSLELYDELLGYVDEYRAEHVAGPQVAGRVPAEGHKSDQATEQATDQGAQSAASVAAGRQ